MRAAIRRRRLGANPQPAFATTPEWSNCHGQSISALVRQFRGSIVGLIGGSCLALPNS